MKSAFFVTLVERGGCRTSCRCSGSGKRLVCLCVVRVRGQLAENAEVLFSQAMLPMGFLLLFQSVALAALPLQLLQLLPILEPHAEHLLL